MPNGITDGLSRLEKTCRRSSASHCFLSPLNDGAIKCFISAPTSEQWLPANVFLIHKELSCKAQRNEMEADFLLLSCFLVCFIFFFFFYFNSPFFAFISAKQWQIWVPSIRDGNVKPLALWMIFGWHARCGWTHALLPLLVHSTRCGQQSVAVMRENRPIMEQIQNQSACLFWQCYAFKCAENINTSEVKHLD